MGASVGHGLPGEALSGAKQYFDFLDGLRGVAALAVMWGHLRGMAGLGGADNFSLAVDFFFILSGFVIAHAYEAPLREGLLRPAGFAWLRVVRLYPLMLAGTLLGLAVTIANQLAFGTIGWGGIAAAAGLALLGLPSWSIPLWPYIFPLNGPQWSLFFEIAVNLVYGLIGRSLTRMAIWIITAAGAIALIAVSFAHGTANVGWDWATFAAGTARIVFGFFCGIAIYHVRRSAEVGAHWGIAIAAGLAVILLWPPLLSLPSKLAAIILVFPTMVHFAASVEARGMLAAVARFLGAISYPLYILHYPLARVLDEIARRLDPDRAHVLASMAAQSLIIVGVSWLALKLFDIPVRGWLRAAGRNRKRPEPSAAPGG